MGAPLEIRLVKDSELDAFLALRQEALERCPLYFAASPEDEQKLSREDWLSRLHQPNTATFLAWKNDQAVGMGGVYPASQRKMAHKSHLWGMYVQSEHRGGGIAKAILQRCIDWCQKQGQKRILLATIQSNQAAISLYESAGFQRYGTEPASLFVDGCFHHDALFSLDLSKEDTNY